MQDTQLDSKQICILTRKEDAMKQIIFINWVLYVLYYIYYSQLPTVYEDILTDSVMYIYPYREQCYVFLINHGPCV
jgi:hypothetical protein